MEFKLEFKFMDMEGITYMNDKHESLEEAIAFANTLFESNPIIESVTIYCLDEIVHQIV